MFPCSYIQKSLCFQKLFVFLNFVRLFQRIPIFKKKSHVHKMFTFFKNYSYFEILLGSFKKMYAFSNFMNFRKCSRIQIFLIGRKNRRDGKCTVEIDMRVW